MKKASTIILGIFTALLFTTAYAASPVKVAKKYNFDKELKQVKSIKGSKIYTWDTIDLQSMIIKTDAKRYYLVVLDQPAPSLPFKDHVDMQLMIQKAAPGSDDLIITDAMSSESYPVYKIYSLKDLAQAHKIAALLTGAGGMSAKIKDKYNFDNELKQAKGVVNAKILNWDTIDPQSLIIRTDANDYYLVILDQPAPSLPFKDHVDMQLRIEKAMPGSDDLIITDAMHMELYPVCRIYSLRNLEQANKIKGQIMKR